VSGRQAIALVASRELAERSRERSFSISTAISVLVLLAVIVLPPVFGLGDDEPVRVGLTGAHAAELRSALVRQGGEEPPVVRLFGSEAAGVRALEEKDVDALVVDGRSILVRDELPEDLAVRLQAASAEVRAQAALEAEGLDARRAARILHPPPLATRALDEQEEGGSEGLAFVAVIVLYGQVLAYGFWVASGVVEEKASRIVEIVLSTITSRQLLAGKIIGIGVLGFLQLLLLAGVGLAAGVAVDALELDREELTAVLVALAWFVLGYAFYATLFAVSGATISRAEELQHVTTPLNLVLLGSFFLSFLAIQDPNGALAEIASLAPPVSAMVMPPRMAAGAVPAWEIVLAVALMAAATAALVPVAARLYSNAVLRTGGRVRLREAWRAER
jgi:ABC-2 type transport system permease protein